MLFIIIAISGDLTGRRRDAIFAVICTALLRTLSLPLGTKRLSFADGYIAFSPRKHLSAPVIFRPRRHR